MLCFPQTSSLHKYHNNLLKLSKANKDILKAGYIREALPSYFRSLQTSSYGLEQNLPVPLPNCFLN